MKHAIIIFLCIVATFIGIQAYHPRIPVSSPTTQLQFPHAVQQVLDEKCYACHSNSTKLSWFDEVQPAYALVRHDVLKARRKLNFSTLSTKPAATQNAVLYEAVSMVQLGAMPLPRYLRVHPQARVSTDELETIKSYLSPWSTPIPPSNNEAVPLVAMIHPGNAKPELNGLTLDADLATWKILSVTDRGDNNTFRLILGNDVSIQAVRAGNLKPWPDGAKIAKITWQRVTTPEGLIRPGAFVQIELMAKDAQRYQATGGWGYGRWKGPQLEPYGSSVKYVTECTGCHAPVADHDWVYTLPATMATISTPDTVNNAMALLPASLPYSPFDWSPKTLYVDPQHHTQSVLFMNATAANAIDSKGNYPAGSLLALVTWQWADDPHWFGARIPGSTVAVEIVKAGATGAISYQRYAPTSSSSVLGPLNHSTDRMQLILGLRPSVYPH